MLRTCLKAVVADDAAALGEAVRFGLNLEDALLVAQQAWRRDVGMGRRGTRMGAGGLLSAVYYGTLRAQDDAGLDARVADNATTLMCALAIEGDCADVLDVFIDWDPCFRMGVKGGGKATVDTTIEFFVDMGAPRCAEKVLERKEDLELAIRRKFKKEHSNARIVMAAKRRLLRGKESGVVTAACEDVVSYGGLFVMESESLAFSVGLFLIGQGELVSKGSTGAVRVAADLVLAGEERSGEVSDMSLFESGPATWVA